MAARSGACASRSGPRRSIFLADPAWLSRSRQVAVDGPSRASLRTRDATAWPAWKAASVRDLSARRRVGVQGEEPGSVLFRWASRRTTAHPLSPSPRITLENHQPPMPSRRSGRKSRDRPSPPRPHPRRRAERSRILATFRAGQSAAPRVRRDARDGPRRSSARELVSQTGSARKMPGLGPDREAQAPERAATGLPLGTHTDSTGDAAEAKVAFSDIKASRRRKRPSLPRWPRRRKA